MLNRIQWKGGNEESFSDYWYWLIEQVGVDDDDPDIDVIRKLYSYEFTIKHPMDKNRIADGLALRKRWLASAPIAGDIFDGRPCSILEMLVALAIRIEDDVMGERMDFFWVMIGNLGLLFFSNETEEEKLEKWMGRRFERNGYGSPFPLNHDDRDQRKLEIWAQCMSYLNEKYF